MTLKDCIEEAYILYNEDRLWKVPIRKASLIGRKFDEIVSNPDDIIYKLLIDTHYENDERLEFSYSKG